MSETTKGAPSFVLYREYIATHDQYRFTLEMKENGQKYTAGYFTDMHTFHSIWAHVNEKVTYDIKMSLCKGIVKVAPWISFDWLEYNVMKMNVTGPDIKEVYKPDLQGLPMSEWEAAIFNKNYKTAADYDLGTGIEVEPSLSEMADGLPGMTTKLYFPCACFTVQNFLKNIIMHLNDKHDPSSWEAKKHLKEDPEDTAGYVWTDEDICDWLDKMHESGVVDLSIEIPDKEITV